MPLVSILKMLVQVHIPTDEPYFQSATDHEKVKQMSEMKVSMNESNTKGE